MEKETLNDFITNINETVQKSHEITLEILDLLEEYNERIDKIVNSIQPPYRGEDCVYGGIENHSDEEWDYIQKNLK